ncbi:hypothetical protein DID73_01025 [Candidatus Marinamargulisbacteria bacterium SCGC AG-343-K17]|nr:hypothetical protein DID73_01025 [Candidatus Marinamargulisbacteria bacterium SCGC AG-343-K17]
MRQLSLWAMIGFISLTPLLNLSAEQTIVTWDMLSSMNYETGTMPPNLKKLNHQPIQASGFIVPLEMDEYADEVKEFLLVPDPLACIHVPPPPPNQIIHVVMNEKIPVNMDYRGVEIKGILSFSKSEDGIHGFEMVGQFAKEANIEYEDPLMEIINIDLDE